MIIKKKRKEVREEPVQKKKKVKSSGSQADVTVKKDVQAVIKSEEGDQLETTTELRKKKNLKDECLDQLEVKKKKKSKKKQADSELLEQACSESFVSGGGHLDSEPQGESEDQIKILKKNKKKAQCHSSLLLKNNQGSGMELSDHRTDSAKENEFSLKKSRKHPALCLELAGEVAKKKKKKVAFPLEDMQAREHRQAGKVCKKQHKSISQDKTFPSENQGTDIIQNDGDSSVRRKKRKKNKDKSDSVLLLADDQDICRAPDSPMALCDFRKRQRKNSQETAVTNREEEDTTNSGSIRETKRKKKKSKDASPLVGEGDQDCSCPVPHQRLPAQQEVEPEEKELSGESCGKTIKNGEVIKKKKKKKIQKGEEERTHSEAFSSGDTVLKCQTPALPGSEVQRAQRGTGDAVDGVLCSSNHLLCDRKRKKSRKEAPQDSDEEPGLKGNAKKKMIKRKDVGNEALEDVDDVTIVQEKKGNCDEVNIDKVRRQALQEEIDRESGKTKVFSPQVERDVPLGQWSTAAFQSSEEKMKFFRLMGGFKKGAVPSHHLSATPNKPNMALTREGEEKLQQALKTEFDKAMDLKQHRGIGLGFQPAAKKKVYIDKYTSRSIKFED